MDIEATFTAHTTIYEHGIHQWCSSVPCIWLSQLHGLIGRLYYYLVALLGIASTFSNGPILMNETGNDVRLAVSPHCGLLPGVVSDVNTGINIGAIKTIVSFGVRVISKPRNQHSDHRTRIPILTAETTMVLLLNLPFSFRQMC